jgi:phospholipid transport system transporter-binding protein
MIRVDGDRLLVEGPITMETAAALLDAGRGLCGQVECSGGRVIDLSGVSAVDSAALAIVLAWMRAARDNGRTLRLEGVPAQLQSLAALYDLGELLPLGAVAA